MITKPTQPIENPASSGADPGDRARAGPSRMAEIVALIRAVESDKPEDERICYDPYALRFISPGTREFMTRFPEQFRAGMEEQNLRMPGLANSIVARVRFFDEVVKSALGGGIMQLVILGAGYDSRAYRMEMPGVRVFEVDHPATVATKSGKVEEIFGSLPGHVAYVPVDFEADDLGRRLAESGYDASKKTLFVMEGLIYYLPPDAVDALFSFIARNSGGGSSVVFDYGRDEVRGSAGGDFAKGQGAPVKSWIDMPIGTFLSLRGFTLIRNMDSGECEKAYFRGKNAGRKASDRSHFAHAVVE